MCFLNCYSSIESTWHVVSPALSLLNPIEFFITVNQSALWQKHVSWAKRDGKELREYITSRYSTNMVLLSLMLGAELSAFFTSSEELLQVRIMLRDTKNVGSLKFWIGLVLLLDVYVTLMGLVVTFTLWGMVSAISDRNSHCILRSSIGQFVISLPPRLVVMSLYLFLLWNMMFTFDLVGNPLSWTILGLILILFFSIIIPISVFGRLILHTGAMSQKAILSDQQEQDLLPSGLHASLLLRATHRQRRKTCVTAQYQVIRSQQDVSSGIVTATASTSSSTHHNATIAKNNKNKHTNTLNETTDSNNGDTVAESFANWSLSFTKNNKLECIDTDGMVFTNNSFSARQQSTIKTNEDDNRNLRYSQANAATPTASNRLHRPLRLSDHNRICSVDTILLDSPPASVLNSTICAQDLINLIETTLRGNSKNNTKPEEQGSKESASINGDSDHNVGLPLSLPHTTQYNTFDYRRSNTTRHHRRVGSATQAALVDWNEEIDVRSLYGVNPPAAVDYLPRDTNVLAVDSGQEQQQQRRSFVFPSPSPQSKQNRSPIILSIPMEDGLSQNGEKEQKQINKESLTQQLLLPIGTGDAEISKDEERRFFKSTSNTDLYGEGIL